ncbi:unnamed protein product [Lactuca saligna]|uniref:Uncharacterized protein n=1 Tax=Lactuca saligna TaxID=75948 RepID=A0AA35VDS0_LACSI|nr:unnamed protein product [Lactuca saligna]
MALPFHVKIIEQCDVSPPPDSVIPPISLPLTFLDIPWLLYPPYQTLFFFPKPPLKSTTTTVISLLKKSLSTTLHHFHPLAGNLSAPPPPAEPHLIYTKGDSVSLTIADSNANINNISGNHPRNVVNLYSLLPKLPIPSMPRDSHLTLVLPLLAIQVTFFHDLGYSIGVTTQQVAADERTLDQFIKCWASVCKSLLNKDSLAGFKSTPLFDRSVISDPNSLKITFLKQWWSRLNSSKVSGEEVDQNIVQATFILTSSDISMIKYHILEKCKMINEDPPLHLSPYVSVCSFIWICLLKVEEAHDSRGTSSSSPLYLGFNAGGISRLRDEIPSTYFGNCIAFGRCRAFRSELLGEDGVVFAAKSIGKEIKILDKDVLGGAERWICEWDELNVRVLGSPKVDSYGMDFGWGKVDKVEKLSSHQNCRANHVISLTGSRDLKGGIEIGVALTKAKMAAFTALFNGGLMKLV